LCREAAVVAPALVRFRHALYVFRGVADNHRMKRRELIVLLGGAAIAGCRSAQAQSRALPLVAFLSPTTFAANIDAFRRGLRELGYVEGQNIALEVRSAEGDNRKLPALSAELVSLKPDVIVTTASQRYAP
jgi:putative ABC transport system substrate-binding protein